MTEAIAVVESRAIAPVQDWDVLQMLLEDHRSPNTRRAYEQDLRLFFAWWLDEDPHPEAIAHWLNLPQSEAIAVVLRWKASMRDRGLAEATINRRLAALKSLVRFSRRLGRCNFSLEDVKGDRVQSYRDTTGTTPERFRELLALPDRQTARGSRNYAILRLLWENALRRSEVVRTRIQDLEISDRRLWILGKGKGRQRQPVSLSIEMVQALQTWLSFHPDPEPEQPLFTALDRSSYGQPLSDQAVYLLVKRSAEAIKLGKRLSPHRIRHSAITAALDATGGNVRLVQKLSRHSRLETLQRYDDARQNFQGECTEHLARMLS
ncbi:tyrosine-type recombinase/integrase [Synechococcus elongatus]|uniref:tyrosine-type recombinase/integrase n=1 Tax=Synechococcus elongatus TaxID=32046 RepID=UPI0030D144F7